MNRFFQHGQQILRVHGTRSRPASSEFSVHPLLYSDCHRRRSITALYYVTLKMARDEESYIARSFFRSFKQNFKQATIINIIMLLTAAVLFIDLRIARAGSGAMYKGLFSLFIAFALIYAMILLYIYPILSKFF